MRIEKVLMVDDDLTIRKLVEVSLTRIGKWTVLSAESGYNALEVVSDYRPDVILLDVMMPGMDGLTAFKQLRESKYMANTPIIFFTAKVQGEEIQSYFKLGAAGVITKPFDPMTLPGEIQKIVNKVAV